MELVDCISEYWDFVRKIRNENVGFVETVDITHEQQISYMEKHNHEYKICLLYPDRARLTMNFPAGFIGEVDGDIRFGVDKKFRNRGVGKFMLTHFLVNENTIGKVKKDNIASKNLFLACDWKEIPSKNKEFYMFKK